MMNTLSLGWKTMRLSVSLKSLEYRTCEIICLNDTSLNITRRPEYEIIGDKSSGRGDFAIRV